MHSKAFELKDGKLSRRARMLLVSIDLSSLISSITIPTNFLEPKGTKTLDPFFIFSE